MIMKKCFKRRTVLVSTLVMLLMVVGYLNNQLTKTALMESSKGYKDHEEIQLSKMKDNEVLETSSKNIQVVESTKNKKVPTKNVEVKKNKEKKNESVKVSSKKAETKKIENASSNANYFVEHRLTRDKSRGESVERLNKLIEDEKTKDDVRVAAQTELIELTDVSEMELLIEGLVKGKGFKDSAVFLNKESVRIVIDKEQLNEEDVMKVLEIVTSETELKPQDIKIMKKQ